MQAQIGKEQWDRYKTVYAPLEDSMVSAAQNYDTPAQYERAAGEASGSVAQAYGNARDRLSRTVGLDPTSPAYTASMAGLDRSQAASDAVAQNTARKQVQDTAWARKSDMLSLGKGLPASAATTLGAASAASSAQANTAYNRSANQAAGLGAVTRDVIGGLSSAWNSANTPGLGSGTFGGSSSGYGFTSGNYSAGSNLPLSFGL
ncbi:hypothetical protein [Cupriavidus basilensis]